MSILFFGKSGKNDSPILPTEASVYAGSITESTTRPLISISGRCLERAVCHFFLSNRRWIRSRTQRTRFSNVLLWNQIIHAMALTHLSLFCLSYSQPAPEQASGTLKQTLFVWSQNTTF